MLKRTPVGVAFLALMLAASALPGASAWTPIVDEDGDEIEPNPYITGNVTITNHKPDCGDDVLCFFDDTNDIETLSDYGFVIHDERVDEPIQFSPAKVDCQFYGEDVEAKSTMSAWCANNTFNKNWLDTANWATSNFEGSGNEVFERVVRNGAHALRFKNSGASVSESDTITFDFTDLNTDIEKTRLHIGLEVVTGGPTSAGTFGYIVVYDGDQSGSESFYLSTSTAVTPMTTNHFLMNGTGVTYWDRLVSSGESSSGGVVGDISKIAITLDADSDVSASEIYIYALSLDAKRYSFGTDDAGEPVYNMTYADCDGATRSAPLGYVCLAEFGPSFGYQNIKDLKVAYILDASTLPDDDVEIIGTELADDPTYDWRAKYEFTFELPKMIDLTYAGDEALKYTLPVGGAAHDALKVAGVDKVKDVNKKKVGDTVVLSTAVAAKKTEVEFSILYSAEQMAHLTETHSVGGLFGPSNPITLFLVWLSGISVVGVAAAKLLTKKHKGT